MLTLGRLSSCARSSSVYLSPLRLASLLYCFGNSSPIGQGAKVKDASMSAVVLSVGKAF